MIPGGDARDLRHAAQIGYALYSPYDGPACGTERSRGCHELQPYQDRTAIRHVGAEISGVDLAQPIPEAVFGEICRAFAEHGVVFFRDQQLTPEQHVGFAGAGRRSTSTVSSRRCRAIRDRRGAQGARAEDQYRRRLAHRPHLRSGARDGLDPAGARAAGGGRRHAVRQHVPRLRDALGRPAAHAARACAPCTARRTCSAPEAHERASNPERRPIRQPATRSAQTSSIRW